MCHCHQRELKEFPKEHLKWLNFRPTLASHTELRAHPAEEGSGLPAVFPQVTARSPAQLHEGLFSERWTQLQRGDSGAQCWFLGVTLSNRSGRHLVVHFGCPQALHRAIITHGNSWGWLKEMPHKLRAGDSGFSLAGNGACLYHQVEEEKVLINLADKNRVQLPSAFV